MKTYLLLAVLISLGSLLATALQQSPGTVVGRHIAWTKYQDQTVQLMRDYVRINTSNPPGNELLGAEFFHRLFDTYGISNTIYPFAPNRADIYAIIKGDGSERPIILLNHMDVVRATLSQWKAPPFSAEILDGQLYGRGALDMKDEGLLQAMVMVIAAREQLPLKRDLIFLATGDEEVDDLGATWFLNHHPDLLRHAEYLLTEGGSTVVYPGQGALFGVDVAEKAPFWLRLIADGRGGHGSIPITNSAPNRLVKAAGHVVNWQPPIRLLPSVESYFHQIAGLQKEPIKTEFSNIRQSLGNQKFRDLMMNNPDFNYLLHNTVSLTVIRSGQQTNVIPDVASADLDVRLLPGEDPARFLVQLQKIVDDPGIKIKSISKFRPPNSSSTDTVLYRVIEAVVHQSDPEAVIAPQLNSGYTESQMFRPFGITAYGFSPVKVSLEQEQTQHAANERVPVEQLRQGLKMLFEVVSKAANE